MFSHNFNIVQYVYFILFFLLHSLTYRFSTIILYVLYVASIMGICPMMGICPSGCLAL